MKRKQLNIMHISSWIICAELVVISIFIFLIGCFSFDAWLFAAGIVLMCLSANYIDLVDKVTKSE